MFVLHKWNSSQKQAEYMQAQKQKKDFCRRCNKRVWATTTSNWFQFSFDGFAWNHADDIDEAHVVKLVKSSTFSYEQAWHRLAALYTIYRTKPLLIVLLSTIYVPYMSFIRIVLTLSRCAYYRIYNYMCVPELLLYSFLLICHPNSPFIAETLLLCNWKTLFAGHL
jgi:hypothetical protein